MFADFHLSTSCFASLSSTYCFEGPISQPILSSAISHSFCLPPLLLWSKKIVYWDFICLDVIEMEIHWSLLKKWTSVNNPCTTVSQISQVLHPVFWTINVRSDAITVASFIKCVILPCILWWVVALWASVVYRLHAFNEETIHWLVIYCIWFCRVTILWMFPVALFIWMMLSYFFSFQLNPQYPYHGKLIVAPRIISQEWNQRNSIEIMTVDTKELSHNINIKSVSRIMQAIRNYYRVLG